MSPWQIALRLNKRTLGKGFVAENLLLNPVVFSQRAGNARFLWT